MVVAAECAPGAAHLLQGVKHIVRVQTGEQAALFADAAVVHLHFTGVFIAVFFISLPGGLVLSNGNVKEQQALWHRRTQRPVVGGQGFHLAPVPVHLVLVHTVILPHKAQIVAVHIATGIRKKQRLGHGAMTVLHRHGIVAHAVHALRPGAEQAVGLAVGFGELLFLIIFADIAAVVHRVGLCIVVTQYRRPVHAQVLHHPTKQTSGGFVVKCAGLERHRVGNVAGHGHQIRLLGGDHTHHAVNGPPVFEEAHPAAANMHIRQLHNTKIPICGEHPTAIQRLGLQLIFILYRRNARHIPQL